MVKDRQIYEREGMNKGGGEDGDTDGMTKTNNVLSTSIITIIDSLCAQYFILLIIYK